ncbi:MAG: MFS transporter [Pseudomonadota bacterium]
MKLSRFTLAAYAFPAFALAVLYLPLFSYVTPFYVAERGVNVAALGAAWIAIRLFDAVSDPVMGWLSDRTPVRLGRRRVWLVLSVPVILYACWQAFVPPEGAGLGHAVLWLFVVTLGWTMAQTPYAAWGAELAPGYHDRTRVTAWRESVVLVGTLAATVLYFQAGEGGDGLRALALCVLVALPLGVLLAAIAVPDRLTQAPKRLNFRAGLEALKANAPFRRLLAAWFFNGAANGVPVTLFLFFVADRLGGEGRDFVLGGEPLPVAAACLLSYFLAAILGVPFWSWLASRISKHRAWGLAMLWACLIFGWALTLTEGDVTAFLIISVLTGLAFGADLALPPAIQADVVELDTQRTGAARAGLFFAIWQVVTKAALALSSGIALIVLGLVGFEAGGVNSETALWTLSILYAGVPIVLKLIAVVLMWRFPLEQRDLEVGAAREAFR